MAQQTINIGAAANDGTGDPARTAFGKVNDNFTELYAQSGHGVIGSTVTTKQDDYAPDGWSACRTTTRHRTCRGGATRARRDRPVAAGACCAPATGESARDREPAATTVRSDHGQ